MRPRHFSTMARYESIFEHALIGICQITPEGRYRTANPALAHILGYASPEALLESSGNIGTQLDADPCRRAECMRHMAEHRTVSGCEAQCYRFITGDTLSLELQAFLERTAGPTVRKPFFWEEVRQVVRRVLQTSGEGGSRNLALVRKAI